MFNCVPNYTEGAAGVLRWEPFTRSHLVSKSGVGVWFASSVHGSWPPLCHWFCPGVPTSSGGVQKYSFPCLDSYELQ